MSRPSGAGRHQKAGRTLRGWQTGRKRRTVTGMCRSIKTLRRPGETATTGELEAAARQYVRKLSGFREPSARNLEAFEAAVAEIAHASRHLVESIGVPVEEGPNRWTPGSGQARTRRRVLA